MDELSKTAEKPTDDGDVLDKEVERQSMQDIRCAPPFPFVWGQTALPLARMTPAPARARMQRVVQRSAHGESDRPRVWGSDLHMLYACHDAKKSGLST